LANIEASASVPAYRERELSSPAFNIGELVSGDPDGHRQLCLTDIREAPRGSQPFTDFFLVYREVSNFKGHISQKNLPRKNFQKRLAFCVIRHKLLEMELAGRTNQGRKRRVRFPNIGEEAQLLGVDPSHLWRVLTGARVSRSLIARYESLTRPKETAQ
jgi:hypothetical protein